KTLEVRRLDRLLVTDAALAHPVQQHIRRRLQVDHEIWPRRVDGKMLVGLPVQRQFIGREREIREQGVLLQQEIADAHRVEQIDVGKVQALHGGLEQENQLHRQRMAAGVAVETIEDELFLGLLQRQVGAV